MGLAPAYPEALRTQRALLFFDVEIQFAPFTNHPAVERERYSGDTPLRPIA